MENHLSQMALVTGIMELVDKERPGMNVNSRQYNAIIKAANVLAEELNKPHVEAEENMGLEAWLASDDVGSSSKFLAFKLSGSELALTGYAHPYDIADFVRCRNLLKAVPELKNRLSSIVTESEVWRGLVEDWDTICQLIDREECDEAYQLITKYH